MIDLLSMGTITSGFGKRTSPTAGASTNHKGIDIVLNNDNIPSVMSGSVAAVGYSSSAGNYVKINQTDGTTASYFHLASLPSLSVGEYVEAGQKIGVHGSTGISTGKHLHFQIEDQDGTAVDPEEYLSGSYQTVSSVLSNQTYEDAKNISSNSLGNILLDIVGKLITFIAVLLLSVLAVYLFMKAFDISII